MWVKKQQLEPCVEQLIGSRSRKEYGRAVCFTLFNLYAEHIMRNAGLDELQVGIKIGRRNVNNLRYAVYTTLMAESRRTKEPRDEGEGEERKSHLKTKYKKN